MSKRTTNLIGILLTILAGIFFYYQLCSSCGAAVAEDAPVEKVVAPAVPETTSYPFALSDVGYSCNVNDNYNFNVSSSTILTPLATAVNDCIGSLKTYLGDQSDKVMNITGFYKSDENNNSAFPNLGLARANAVKNHLVEQGISSTQINTFGQLKEEMISKDNIYYGPVSYSLETEAANAMDDMKALRDKINADPLVLYFDTAEASISLTAAQRQKIADISRYIDKVADASCNVVGHTDNTGKASTNMRLGQNRADFAKDYLMKNGISGTKINASSKGQTQPVATNASEDGKAKNRRTEVTLK
ncbi:OmpA family protein [Aurantibacter crassamenti]|uniref:OmpA family protein n=1 Tax=Aurantibacter crassamenti TaxID=1837375 RepID=UPI0019392E41|nr:OmpA family protein [Aurantibacter crassamenti]MBM1104941.1 OmpA family protein [Aurantibacter crassamenti]